MTPSDSSPESEAQEGAGRLQGRALPEWCAICEEYRNTSEA